ncbi:hypothetical protein NP493_21g07004 [Ridgeia piscesae]|uniref:Uncharacterized protein n=1 Tax=Ridgeia piscesae TaxID=27915 RepID=A0AAD9PDV4_RIDPI|nr:hypothetical protein NP493_21g07004 [Ridgeia piscesae]
MCAVVICCSPHSPPEIRNAVCRHDHRQATSVDDNFTHSHIRRRHHDRRSTRIANTRLVFSPFATTTANLETQTGQIFRRQLHAFTDPPAPPRSPFNSIETRHRQNPLLFSTFGFATPNPECRVSLQSQTSQIFRRQLHAFTHPPAPSRSPFNSHRNATSPKRYKGNRTNSAQRVCFFQIPEHPMLPQQQPVSSNSASYVLSVSCLFLCGPLRRISVNARFYVQCCLVL